MKLGIGLPPHFYLSITARERDLDLRPGDKDGELVDDCNLHDLP
jgi:hypothetical protein